MKRKDCVAMLLVGGQGSRLRCLTSDIAKPGIVFGGKYRIVDFCLSNCVNSGIEIVGMLTQYKPFLLNSYVGVGSAWDLDVDRGGLHILPPYQGQKGGTWYKGTANAIYQNINYIDQYNPKQVLILSGDHIYKMDYTKMLAAHKANRADVTIAVLEVPYEEASRFGIMTVDEKNRITKFTEKPREPDGTLASMGIYVFEWEVLRNALIVDEANPDSENDFGKNVIPRLLKEGKRMFAYRHNGYWKDVGTIDSYYWANMELLGDTPSLDLYDRDIRIISNSNADAKPPQYIGPEATIRNSIISNGCRVLGHVENSILSPGVVVGAGASIRDSILFPEVEIGEEALLEKTIVGENARIGSRCQVGGEAEKTAGAEEAAVISDGITIIENGVRLEPGTRIAAGREITKERGEGA